MNNTFSPELNKYISKLCYGTLTIGPLQRGFTSSFGANLMMFAIENGINFFDTAEIYGNYTHFKEMFKMGINRNNIIISTKSYSFDEESAKISLNKALTEMGTDYIDMFLLHEQESEHTLRGHYDATKYFLRMKEKGIIKAFGISTHHNQALEAVLETNYIDVIHPIVNKLGIGIVDGTMDESIQLLKKIKDKGIFIYGMKPLAGGHLINNYNEAIDFVMNQDYLDSFAIGMQSKSEIIANTLYIKGETIPKKVIDSIDLIKRKLLIHDWCTGCGLCVERCQQDALKIINKKAVVNQNKCTFCGYCSEVCPQMCIKVI